MSGTMLGGQSTKQLPWPWKADSTSCAQEVFAGQQNHQGDRAHLWGIVACWELSRAVLNTEVLRHGVYFPVVLS